jgi:hypothetical protein
LPLCLRAMLRAMLRSPCLKADSIDRAPPVQPTAPAGAPGPLEALSSGA